MLTTAMCVPMDSWELWGMILWYSLFSFASFILCLIRKKMPKLKLALISVKFTYPPCLKTILINIKVASMIAVLFVSSRMLFSFM